MAMWSPGSTDIVQCLWSEIQEGSPIELLAAEKRSGAASRCRTSSKYCDTRRDDDRDTTCTALNFPCYVFSYTVFDWVLLLEKPNPLGTPNQ